MCKRRNQNSTKDLKQQLIKNGTYQNRDYQGKNFERKILQEESSILY